MPGPFSTSVARSVPYDSAITENDTIGSSVQDLINVINSPTISQAPTYLGNGEVDYIEFFRTSSQITSNRAYRIDITYDGSLNPTSEVWKLYDTDGTTILKTVTFTNAFTGVNFTSQIKATT